MLNLPMFAENVKTHKMAMYCANFLIPNHHTTKPFGNMSGRSTFDLFVQIVWHGPKAMTHMLSTVCGFQYSTVAQIASAFIFDKNTRHVKVASAKLSIMIVKTLWNKVHMLQALTQHNASRIA